MNSELRDLSPSKTEYVCILLIVFGIFVCAASVISSEIGGKEMFIGGEDSNGNYVFSYELDKTASASVRVEANGCDVNIIPTDGKNMIEVMNFPSCTYKIETGIGYFSIYESKSVFNIINNLKDPKFGGLRNYFASALPINKNKIINIYLNKEENTKSLYISCTNGNLIIREADDVGFEYNLEGMSGANIVYRGNNVGDGLYIQNQDHKFKIRAKLVGGSARVISEDT